MFSIHVFTIYVYIWLSETQGDAFDRLADVFAKATRRILNFLLIHTWARGTLHQSISTHSWAEITRCHV